MQAEPALLYSPLIAKSLSAADSAARTAGGIKEVLPVAEIMQRRVAETEAALSRAVDFR